LGLDPHRCSNELSVSFCSPVALAGSGQWHSYAEDKRPLAADHGSTSPRTEELRCDYGSISLRVRTAFEREPPYRHQARPWAGVRYVRETVLETPKPKRATGNGTKRLAVYERERCETKLLNPGVRVQLLYKAEQARGRQSGEWVDSSSSETTLRAKPKELPHGTLRRSRMRVS